MCWKHEWAKAINNLNKAETYVDRARASLQQRLLIHEKTFQKLSQSKKYNNPGSLNPVQKLIQKNKRGIDDCNQITVDLRVIQDALFVMVHHYGLKRSVDPIRVYHLMGNYDIRKALRTLAKEAT